MKTQEDIKISIENKQLISVEVANHYRIIPKEFNDDGICFFISVDDNTNSIAEELELLFGQVVYLESVESSKIDRALSVYYRTSNQNTVEFSIQDSDFLERIIKEAQSIGSSDIHFEVFEKEARVRLRIDGLLIEKYKIKKVEYQELVNKVKIKANLDITEKRLPQDGRINYSNFDIRTSILPTLHGEKIVLRILGRDSVNISLEKLGFDEFEKETYLESAKRTSGIILISGPTGSGKTTTLYATLKILNDIKRNIVTVEDPIEYTLEGINQVQLKEDIGLTFSSALRSFLRQDPDIIMLGEIRDTETAKMAIRASLTGHLVLSTIHTNSALGTISRLVDMGIPPFLIAETLNISVAQRLVRKLCNHCKKQKRLDIDNLPQHFETPYQIKNHSVAVGCSKCYYTGYNGRRAIYELIPINEELALQIKKDAKIIESISLKKDYKSLSDKAFDLLASQETSLEEVYSILIKN